MTENVKDTVAERDALRTENEDLRKQLAAARAAALPGARVQQPEHVFQLSEGDRQELEIRGVVNVGGRLLTRDEVIAKLGKDQRNVKIAEAPEGTRVDPAVSAGRSAGIRGVDFVYPSVEPGLIDPKVAGTPGISGPSA